MLRNITPEAMRCCESVMSHLSTYPLFDNEAFIELRAGVVAPGPVDARGEAFLARCGRS